MSLALLGFCGPPVSSSSLTHANSLSLSTAPAASLHDDAPSNPNPAASSTVTAARARSESLTRSSSVAGGEGRSVEDVMRGLLEVGSF